MVKKTKKEVKKSKGFKTVEMFTKQLLGLLELPGDFEISEEKEEIRINFRTDNPALLIGYHGETLFSFQFLLSLMTYKKLGEWVRVLVDVDGYRQRRQEVLERMAFSIAQKVKFSGEEQSLPPMGSAERRIIHLALANQPGIKTESFGEGSERHVVVKPEKVN